jgi:hypothetical protein
VAISALRGEGLADLLESVRRRIRNGREPEWTQPSAVMEGERR